MKNVIMLTHKIYPLTAGDALYTWGIYQELKEYVNLKVFAYIVGDLDKSIENIVFYPLKGKYDSFNKKMFQDVCNYIEKANIDIIILNHVVMYKYLKPLKKKYPFIKYFYISHNVEYINDTGAYADNIKNKKGGIKVLYWFYYILKRVKSKQRERLMLTQTNAYFSISKADMELQKRLYKNILQGYYLKPVIDFNKNKDENDMEHYNKKLLIAGSMSWYPNVEGTLWFINEVFQKLIKDGYVLYVVGNNPSERIVELSKKQPQNIIVTGFVESVDKYFAECDISIVPLFEGTGAKIKVLESIGRGILTISTGYATKDYAIRDEIIIANTAQEFIDAIKNFENNVNLRKVMYKKAQTYYKEYNTIDKEIIKLLEE